MEPIQNFTLFLLSLLYNSHFLLDLTQNLSKYLHSEAETANLEFLHILLIFCIFHFLLLQIEVFFFFCLVAGEFECVCVLVFGACPIQSDAGGQYCRVRTKVSFLIFIINRPILYYFCILCLIWSHYYIVTCF